MRLLAVGATLILMAGKLVPFGGLETISWWLVFTPMMIWLGVIVSILLSMIVGWMLFSDSSFKKR
jgi:ABC-type antimicrobial peptide transport system permease subunit